MCVRERESAKYSFALHSGSMPALLSFFTSFRHNASTCLSRVLRYSPCNSSPLLPLCVCVSYCVCLCVSVRMCTHLCVCELIERWALRPRCPQKTGYAIALTSGRQAEGSSLRWPQPVRSRCLCEPQRREVESERALLLPKQQLLCKGNSCYRCGLTESIFDVLSATRKGLLWVQWMINWYTDVYWSLALSPPLNEWSCENILLLVLCVNYFLLRHITRA